MSRTWTIQRAENTDAQLRFYTPHLWAFCGVAVLVLFFGAAVEWVRRGAVPMWVLIPAFMVVAFNVAGSTFAYRHSPDGMLHFQINRNSVSFDGLAFRRPACAPYSALRRVLVGDRYLGLVAPVLFEFHPAAISQHGLSAYHRFDPNQRFLICSYRGVSRADFELALDHFLPRDLPVVRFSVVNQPSQLEQQATNA